MAVQTEGNRLNDVLKYESGIEKYMSREQVLVASGQALAIGAVLGKICRSCPTTGTAGTNTGEGTCALVAMGPKAKFGTYTLTCIADEKIAAILLGGDYVLNKSALATGSTTDRVAHGAVEYLINGVTYKLAANAGGVELTAQTVPQNKYGAWALEVGANGTVDVIPAPANATGYDSAAAAAAALPEASADHARIGYLTASSNDAGGFVAGTTAISDAAVTEAFTDAPTVFELLAGAGPFSVTDPDGNSLPDSVVGIAYTNDQINFTLTASGAAFVSGDTFTITVTAGSGKVKEITFAAVDGTEDAFGVLLSQEVDTMGTLKYVAYTSGGTYEIRPGDLITGATSGATARVHSLSLSSGTWAGGNAAGILILDDQVGTFQSENLNVGAELNVATIGGNTSTHYPDLPGVALVKDAVIDAANLVWPTGATADQKAAALAQLADKGIITRTAI